MRACLWHFSSARFPGVERIRGGAAPCGGLGGHVEVRHQAAVVAPGPVHVAADLSGDLGDGRQASNSGESVGAAECVHVAAGVGYDAGLVAGPTPVTPRLGNCTYPVRRRPPDRPPQ